MDDTTLERPAKDRQTAQARRRHWWRWPAGLALVAALGAFWISPWNPMREAPAQASAAAMPPLPVTVSAPLVRNVDTEVGFLGQFSAVDRVELRAQVGGTLTQIAFKDG